MTKHPKVKELLESLTSSADRLAKEYGVYVAPSCAEIVVVKRKPRHNKSTMKHKVITIARDHKERFSVKDIRECDKFITSDDGEGDVEEIGVDDMYVMFFFSKGMPGVAREWILSNRYKVWYPLTEGVEFNDLEDLVAAINKNGAEIGEEWEDIGIAFGED